MSKPIYQPVPQIDSILESESEETSHDVILEVPEQKSQTIPHKSRKNEGKKRKDLKITLKDLQVIKTLLPYLWRDLATKIRVTVALLCLVLAKVPTTLFYFFMVQK
jgi:hypothetical protein